MGAQVHFGLTCGVFSKKNRTMGLELEEYWDNIDGPAKRQISVVVVGCGQRGTNYAAFALDFPSRMKVVAVAEPVEHRRKRMLDLYGLEEDRAVDSWERLL